MINPIPENEAQRLSTILQYRILDTEYDTRFENLVQIACEFFAAPIALISLVDTDRQWFKAAVGMDVCQTSRQDSFCAHAIMRPDEVMVVEDALLDSRFCDKPAVVGDPHVRFYAGAPIVAANGTALGTVCVLDRKPRTFDAASRALLMRLAAMATSLLDLHRRNALLREQAKRDPLTGLLNRRGLEGEMDELVDPARPGNTCGLLYVDLDHFKQVNDSHGHAIGDSLLEEIASRLQDVVREGDVVARLGGDEFAILLAHPVDQVVLELVAQRVLWACTEPMTLQGRVIRPGLTVGGALAPRDALTLGDLLRTADRALYCAKRSGRGRVAFAGRDNDIVADQAARPVLALVQALERNELFLDWQACRNIRTGNTWGYEALVRWNHPDLGLLGPDRFVPLAETCGLSARLDSWVLLHACEEAAQSTDDVHFSVNVSAQWVSSGAIVPMVRAALAQSGLHPGRLVLEITESTPITNEVRAIACMNQLRAMGVQFALDDFGTGYSALSYLQTYPFDIVKLDRAFVSAIGTSLRGLRLATGVMQLARGLDLDVVAEGVETLAEADLLAAAGCTHGQGFLWARPQCAPWLVHATRADVLLYR